MAERNETLADIVAEMRNWSKPHHHPDRSMVAMWADRIEAAAKRAGVPAGADAPKPFDSSAFEGCVKSARNSGWSKIADPVAEIRRMRGDYPIGNAAKLREALKSLIDIAEEDCIVRKLELGDLDVTVEKRRCMLANAKAALAAPPRNCDRFDDDDDAFAAWHDSLVDGDVVCVRNGFRWLFALASQEGGGHADD